MAAQEVAHLDATKLLAMIRRRCVPVVGGVDIMTGMRCPGCGTEMELHPPVAPSRSTWSQGVGRLVWAPFTPQPRAGRSCSHIATTPASHAVHHLAGVLVERTLGGHLVIVTSRAP